MAYYCSASASTGSSGVTSSSSSSSHCCSISRLIISSNCCRSSNQQQLLLFNSRRKSQRFYVRSQAKPDIAVTVKQGDVSSIEKSKSNAEAVAQRIKYHAEFTPSFSPEGFGLPKAYYATAQSIRDSLVSNWNATYDMYERMNTKQAYYLSMEFLQGRALLNAIGNLELTGAYGEALTKLGHKLEDVVSQEPDAALGNGGLGRLASCFLDSLATLNYPAWGYGLRYKYGLFKQLITKEGQEEVAETWLEMGNPWEIVRNDISYPVKFYGKVVTGSDGKRRWIGGEDIVAVANDVPIPGYKTKTTINLRLWDTKVPPADFDLAAFNSGDHTKACESQANAEKICYILYPGDDSLEGKTLRLKQQYTLCSASLQDIITRFEKRSGETVTWKEFPEKVAVQMNDTHPTLCIPELMRILMDVKGISWKEAWNITQRTVAYTNHTVLPEALEKWSLDLMQKLLPRHVEIIEMIDEELVNSIVSEFGKSDPELLEKKLNATRILENVELPSSIAELFIKPEETPTIDTSEVAKVSSKDSDGDEEDESVESNEEEEAELQPAPVPPKLVRMANLCVVGGHVVNGVAEIHSEIVKQDVFNDFYKLWPDKFQNKTNGVTPRRWISYCNPDLSKIITKWTDGDDWVLNTEKLAELRKFADSEDLQSEWRAAKRINKLKVVSFLKEKTGYSVSPDAMFDIQVKRIHEYKRQLLNILGIVYRYKKMKEMNVTERKEKFTPRVCRQKFHKEQESRIKLAAVNESEKQHLQQFANACKGIPQVVHPSFPFNNQGPNVGTAAQTTTTEDPELAMAIIASLQSSSVARPTAPATHVSSGSTLSAGSVDTTPHNKQSEKWETYDVGASSSASTSYHPNADSNAYAQIVPAAPVNITPSLIPSAPPLPDIVDDGPVHYPSIDYTPSDLSETKPAATTGEKDKMDSDSLSCFICLDAPVEGACIPCGHMAGCMTCLTEIKGKNWGCPVCRTKIDQVIRLYAV